MKKIEWFFATALMPFSLGMIAECSVRHETISGSVVVKFDNESRNLTKSGTNIT